MPPAPDSRLLGARWAPNKVPLSRIRAQIKNKGKFLPLSSVRISSAAPRASYGNEGDLLSLRAPFLFGENLPRAAGFVDTQQMSLAASIPRSRSTYPLCPPGHGARPQGPETMKTGPGGWVQECVCWGAAQNKTGICEVPPCLSGQGGLPGGGSFWLGS